MGGLSVKKMIWNENELVFSDNLNKGIAGISNDQPDSLGVEIAKRYNNEHRPDIVVCDNCKYKGGANICDSCIIGDLYEKP